MLLDFEKEVLSILQLDLKMERDDAMEVMRKIAEAHYIEVAKVVLGVLKNR